jgi:hypothetical protein
LTVGAAADHLAAMHWLLHWLTTAALIVGLVLAFRAQAEALT